MTNGGFIVVCIIFAVVFFFAAGSCANDYDGHEHGGCFLGLFLFALWLMTCAICWRVGYRRGINETETYHIIQSAQQGEVQK